MKKGNSGVEKLEAIFGNDETVHRRGFFYHLFVFVLMFVFGIFSTYVSLLYIFPYLASTNINIPLPDYLTVNNQGETVKVIERTEEKRYVEESSIIDVVNDASPAVVSILSTTYYRGFFGQILSQEGGGTGFIITQDGKIITNKHVVEDERATYKVIMKSGLEYDVVEISKDPFSDLALLSIVDAEGQSLQELPVVRIGDSTNLSPGQKVIAIGNALGRYDSSVTTGVISATGRKILASDAIGRNKEELKGLIQTDAAINPGNSGGPLLNIDGEVIGINTAVANAQNIGFAIPVNDIKPILRSVEVFGEIKRPYLGISYRMINPNIAQILEIPVTKGALLIGDSETLMQAVDPDSPAGKAGLKEGDIITEIDAYEISQENTVLDVLRNYIPNEEVTLRVYRPRKVISEIEDGVTDYIDIVVILGEMI
jgi:serine protease Do